MNDYKFKFFINDEVVDEQIFAGANRFCAEMQADEYCKEFNYNYFIGE